MSQPNLQSQRGTVGPSGRWARHRWLWVMMVGAVAVAVLLPAVRAEADTGRWAGSVAVLTSLLGAGGLVALYGLCVIGLGWPMARLLLPRGGGDAGGAGGAGMSGEVRWLQPALGLAALLALTHALGVAGLLSGVTGAVVAPAVLLGGAVLAGVQAHRARGGGLVMPRLPGTALLALPAVAAAIAAACSPPGYLWESEAGGFDSLSYHLQLPVEWARTVADGGAGRLWPLEHNVYSYLPSAVESLYLHLHALLGGGVATAGQPAGMLAFDGLGLVAAQFLHAGMGLLAALLTARVASVVLRGWLPVERRALAGGVAGAALVGTPWVVVVSSLSYNECGVLVFFAAALLATVEPTDRPVRRALVVGLLLGSACACKPTAAFLVGPTIGAMWLLAHKPSRWPMLALAGAAGVALTFGPALVRNAAASGNPVFPAGARVFGGGHWTAEQSARFASAHAAVGPWSRGLAAMFETTGSPTAAAESDARHPRGWLHPQWSVLPILGGACMAGLLAARVGAVRRVAVGMAIGMVVACVWWAGFSHAQSRFLVPLAVPLAVAVGVGFGLLIEPSRQGPGRRAAAMLVAALPAVAAVSSLTLLLAQRGSHPFRLMTTGVGQVLGTTLREPLSALGPEGALEQLSRLDPPTACNLLVPAGEELVLLGESAPLYFVGPVKYATTWDAPPGPIAAAAGAAAVSTPAELARLLRPARGARWVFVNIVELERLHAAGWLDPRLSPVFVRGLLAALGQPVLVWRAEEADAPRAVRAALYRVTAETGTPVTTP